jgi:glucose-1-phosphate thymidylyltransferase
MKIIILCGGLGTRLRPLTLQRPKPLLNVAGRPVLNYLLDELLELEKLPRFQGNLEFIFVIGHLGERIVAHVQNEYIDTGRLKGRFVEQPQPRGTSDAVLVAREAVFSNESDPELLLIYSDTLFETDFEKLTTPPQAWAGSISYRETSDNSTYGAVVLDANDASVARLVEKPQTFVSNLALVSPYYLTSARQLYTALDEQVARGLQTRGEYYLTDGVQLMIEQGAQFQPCRVSLWLDTGTFENLLSTNRVLLDRRFTDKSPVAQIKGHSLIIPPCQIAESAVLENSVVGPYVTVGPGAVIRQSLVNDCIIEAGCKLSKISLRASVIGPNAAIDGHSLENLYLGDYNKLEL